MAGFIARRVLSSVIVVVLTSIFVFVLFFKGLGDAPARSYCEKLSGGRTCTTAKLDVIRHQMGFDKSVTYNYEQWAKGIFAGRKVFADGREQPCPAPCLGVSITSGDTVWNDLKQKYPATLTLAVGGATLYLVLGVMIGAFAARWRGTSADRALVGSTLIVSSIPYYLVALLAWIYLSLQLKIFPNTEYYPITHNPAKTVSYMALPWLVLGITNCTQYARFSRGQMVETLGEDYIRTASAKGVKTNTVLFKHALRAAIVPVITIFGLDFATLLAGTIFTEKIFGIDGIGAWSLQALQTPLDLQVVSAAVLVSSILVVVANLLVDILYSFLDPRVSVA